MKRHQWLRLFAVLLCLLCAVAVMASCSGQGSGDETTGGGSSNGGETSGNASDETTASSTVKINIADYALLVSDNASDEAQAAANVLLSAVTEKLGAEFKSFGTDAVSNTAEIDPNAFEILVGVTNRPESEAALAELNGAVGFVIKMTGNKIVIHATVDLLLDEAVQYFVTEYVEKGASGSFEVSENLVYANTSGGVALLESGSTLRFDLVYSSSLDTSQGADQYDRVDYVVLSYLDLFKDYSAKFDDVSFIDDKVTADSATYEILLGRTNRPETMTFLNSLKVNEYGYGVVGNKIVVAGWSDLTTSLAVKKFMADLENYSADTALGENYVFLSSVRKVFTKTEWDADVPLYSGGQLDGVMELINNGYMAYYINTTPDEYKAYCGELTAAGYKVHQENQIGDNLYITVTNGKMMIHAYYTEYQKSVRVIVESMATAILPQNSDISYEKITDVQVTMFDFNTKDGNWGNCFIITLEDGSFLLHDGGAREGGTDIDVDELWALLQHLNKRKDGKVVIAGWIISHQHYDHFKNAYDMFVKYLKTGNLKLEKIIFNVPSESLEYNSRNPNAYWKNGSFNTIKLKSGCEFVVMHTGQTIQLRNIKMEIMYTCDDIYPLPPEKFNNSAFVTRFAVGEGENRQSLMILGDAEEVACKIMVDMHGDGLKTDIISVAHHGWGGSVAIYAKCKPTVVMWPHTQAEANSQLSTGQTGYYPTINQSLCNQSNVKLLVVGDVGHRTFTMPLVGLSNNKSENLANFVVVTPRFDGLYN